MLQVTSPATLDAIKLEQAAELIDKGWAQGAFRREIDGAPHYCALGAVNAVSDDDSAQERLDSFIKSIVPGPLYPGFGAIAYFNDHIATNAGEVSGALRKAAEIARGEVA